MNDQFKSLSPIEMLDAFRVLPPELLRATFDLTDEEIRVGISASKQYGGAHDQITDEQTKDTDQSRFVEFLKTEYNNIASAHFNTNTTITQFFQFYLLILGVPITVASILIRVAGERIDVASAALSYGGLIPGLAGLIAVVGMCMMAYLVTLRLDSLLYARTVNGIRQYFFNRSGIDLSSELAMRTLPRTTTQPRLFEPRFFGSVVMTFALLDTVYYAICTWMTLTVCGVTILVAYYAVLSTAIVFMLVHVGLYYALCQYRESHYLRTHIIGVDVDGVLNNHRKTFCDILAAERDLQVDSDSISHIPVHDCQELKAPNGRAVSVSEQDEHAVFNRVSYWRSLEAAMGAATVVRELRETFNFEVVIFTYRPWPNPVQYEAICNGVADRWNVFQREWNGIAALSGTKPFRKARRRFTRWLERRGNRFLEWCRFRAMTRITKKWLEDAGIGYDRLIVERGNVHVTDPRGKVRNRFRISAAREIRIFIEDDLDKAKKLARVCEVVYLLEQPYNKRDDQASLPNNIIRVPSWEAIRQHIKENL